MLTDLEPRFPGCSSDPPSLLGQDLLSPPLRRLRRPQPRQHAGRALHDRDAPRSPLRPLVAADAGVGRAVIEYGTRLRRRQRVWYWYSEDEATQVVWIKAHGFERSALCVIELPDGRRVTVHRSSVYEEKPV